MKLDLFLKLMLAALAASKWRIITAIICVSLSIAAVEITLALDEGARVQQSAIADKLGKNIFFINSDYGQTQTSAGRSAAKKLTMADGESIQKNVSGVKLVSPIKEGRLRAKYAAVELATMVKGVSLNYIEVQNFALKSGRIFDESDNRQSRRVAIIGGFISKKMSQNSPLIGEKIWIANTPFEVIGELQSKGISVDGTNYDDQILIPINTAMTRIFNGDDLSRLVVQTYPNVQFVDIQKTVTSVLRRAHKLPDGSHDDFKILSSIRENAAKKMSNVFLGGISLLFTLITLIVACVGMFSITLLNVKARHKEIGLRRAVGARKIDIALMFVVEACVISLAGGLVGLILGYIFIVALSFTTGWELAINYQMMLMLILLSLLVGLMSSLRPASVAAKLNPLDALGNK